VVPELRFAVLGPVRAWRGDTELDLGSPQQRAVLAVLLLAEGRQVSLSALVDALWADDPPAASVGTVRTYMSRLRQCLRAHSGARGDIIESAGDGYCLPLRSVALDLAVFLERTKEAQAAAETGEAQRAAELLRDALGLWQGVPLAGIPGEYAETQRVRLAALQMDALEERLALDIKLGCHVTAAAELQGLLASYPMRERLSELLMLALYRSGRQADALAVFGHTRRLLSEELGIDPGAALQDMHQRILQADESLIGPAGRDSWRPAAPSPVTAPVGRAVERRSSRYPVVGFGAGGNDKGTATADSGGTYGP
jgi:DNA-binding SARP family transcriptional activator